MCDIIWYDAAPLGKNTIGNKMKTMSASANLSKVYTNHCLRATCVTVLDQSGFEARHIIISVSGHKAETSIKSYSHHVSEDQRRNMSLAISNNYTNNDQNPSSGTCTFSL